MSQTILNFINLPDLLTSGHTALRRFHKQGIGQLDTPLRSHTSNHLLWILRDVCLHLHPQLPIELSLVENTLLNIDISLELVWVLGLGALDWEDLVEGDIAFSKQIGLVLVLSVLVLVDFLEFPKEKLEAFVVQLRGWIAGSDSRQALELAINGLLGRPLELLAHFHFPLSRRPKRRGFTGFTPTHIQLFLVVENGLGIIAIISFNFDILFSLCLWLQLRMPWGWSEMLHPGDPSASRQSLTLVQSVVRQSVTSLHRGGYGRVNLYHSGWGSYGGTDP